MFSLAACGMIASSAGILQSSTTATGDPTVGPPFLLPAYAAAFLGSTQFRGGRYNVWGTIIAVMFLLQASKACSSQVPRRGSRISLTGSRC